MIDGKKIIALCTTRINDTPLHSFIKVLNSQIKDGGFRLLVFTLNTDLYWEEDAVHSEAYVFDVIPYDRIDYLLLMDERIKSKKLGNHILDCARKYNIPHLVIDGNYENAPSIRFDYEAGFEKIVRHVIEDHHHRNVHMMAGQEDNKFSNDRVEVFKKVLKDNGIDFDPSMVSHGDFWSIPSRAATKVLLKREVLPEAIVCANDIMAINVCDVLVSSGLSVPEDIAVTGFDGIEETNFSIPRISTANCDSIAMAKAVAEIIMSDKPDGIKDEIKVIPELDLKESCGCHYHSVNALSSIAKLNDRFYRYYDDIRELHGVTARMQMSKNDADLAQQLHDVVCDEGYLMHSLTCVLFASCFEHDRNIFFEPTESIITKKKLVLCDCKSKDSGLKELEDGELLPHMHELLETGFPLIFNAVDNLNKPLGYICYCFDSYNIIDYSKSISITSAISMGISGFINMQYQQYLSDKVDEMYKYDALTGLFTRAGFLAALEKLKKTEEKKDVTLTVIMADLDDLKKINDTYGHDAGDKAIATVATMLKKACPDNALCMRYGGDEMLGVVRGECDAEAIIEMTNRYLKEYNDNSKYDYNVAVSCGSYTTRLTEELSFDDVVKYADEKMYVVKKAKKKAGDR